MIFTQCIVPDFLHCNWSAVLTPQLNAFLSNPLLHVISCKFSVKGLIHQISISLRPSLSLLVQIRCERVPHQICISLSISLLGPRPHNVLLLLLALFPLLPLFSTLPYFVTYFSSVTLRTPSLSPFASPSLLQACVVSTHLCCWCPLFPLPPEDLPGYHLVVAWVVQVLPRHNGPKAP